MYCRSARVCPCRPMSLPESSVLTSRSRPSSMWCSSTVVLKPSRLRIFSRVALGSAGMIRDELGFRVQEKAKQYGSGSTLLVALFPLFWGCRQGWTLCGGRTSRGRRGRRGGLGKLGLQYGEQVLDGPV